MQPHTALYEDFDECHTRLERMLSEGSIVIAFLASLESDNPILAEEFVKDTMFGGVDGREIVIAAFALQLMAPLPTIETEAVITAAKRPTDRITVTIDDLEHWRAADEQAFHNFLDIIREHFTGPAKDHFLNRIGYLYRIIHEQRKLRCS